jgi:ribose transport system ATP-binding protein
MTTAPPRLQLDHISKGFPGVQAVQDVSLSAAAGEVLALVGENGAGKSTLMNVLTGALTADAGTIALDGQPLTIDSPRRARDLGITMIHQELALLPQLTVGQNIFLGREPRRWRMFIDWRALYERAQAELDRLGLPISARVRVADLSIAQRQMVEIARALAYQARLIVLDEPTSALTERETETLFGLIRGLRAQGVTLIYISHRLEEVFALADRIAVMRDGRLIGVAPANELTPERVVTPDGRARTTRVPTENRGAARRGGVASAQPAARARPGRGGYRTAARRDRRRRRAGRRRAHGACASAVRG